MPRGVSAEWLARPLAHEAAPSLHPERYPQGTCNVSTADLLRTVPKRLFQSDCSKATQRYSMLRDLKLMGWAAWLD